MMYHSSFICKQFHTSTKYVVTYSITKIANLKHVPWHAVFLPPFQRLYFYIVLFIALIGVNVYIAAYINLCCLTWRHQNVILYWYRFKSMNLDVACISSKDISADRKFVNNVLSISQLCRNVFVVIYLCLDSSISCTYYLKWKYVGLCRLDWCKFTTYWLSLFLRHCVYYLSPNIHWRGTATSL